MEKLLYTNLLNLLRIISQRLFPRDIPLLKNLKLIKGADAQISILPVIILLVCLDERFNPENQGGVK
jgi:hypothetical protein